MLQAASFRQYEVERDRRRMNHLGRKLLQHDGDLADSAQRGSQARLKLEIRFRRSGQSASEVLSIPRSIRPSAKAANHSRQDGNSQPGEPSGLESQEPLIEAIAKGRYWLAQLMAGVTDTQTIAKRASCSDRQVRDVGRIEWAL
jgi:hypothetical protein